MARTKSVLTAKAASPRVLFGHRTSLEQDLPENTVLIVPSEDTWNDFGYQTRIDYRVRGRGQSQTIGLVGFIGFVASRSSANGIERLLEILRAEDAMTASASAEHRFFTMLPEMNAYRILIKAFGSGYAAEVLRAANDLVALGELEPAAHVLDDAIESEIFNLSFVRSSDSYFAFKNAGSLLRGLDGERLGSLSATIAIRFRLQGRENDHDLKFQFDHFGPLPRRIAVIIGKNGVGKSQTLGRIARAALDGAPELTDGTDGGRPVINRLLAFAPTNEAESVFPAARMKRARIWYQRYSVNRSRRAKRNEYISDLIIQVARSTEDIASRSRWEIFIEALGAITADEQLHLTPKGSAIASIPLSRLNIGGPQRRLEQFASIDVAKEPMRLVGTEAFQLSSGEISFLKFAAQVSLHIENGSLLLIDEPETHLHPNFISRFVALLDNLLKSTDSSAIVATHSAYFVREVFREQVIILSVDSENRVHAQSPALRTFGADIGAISYFVFGEDEPSELAAEVERKLLEGHASWSQIYEQYRHELSLEFLNALRRAIEGRDGS